MEEGNKNINPRLTKLYIFVTRLTKGWVGGWGV